MRLTALALAFATAAHLGQKWERLLVVEPVDGMQLFSQGGGEGPSNGSTQSITASGDVVTATYAFKNFDRDRLTIDFRLKKSEWAKYDASFGYYKKDISEIDAWLNTARDGAFKYAVKSGKSQAQLDAALAALDKERKKKIDEYMASRGFRLLPGNIVRVDVPSLVKRNAPLLNSIATAFDRIAQERRYGSEAIVGSVASMVQTALVYRIPPEVESDGRHTGGMLPPATTLLKGWGDCDTKSALLSAILVNWPNMRVVGVAVPDHYLMGVLRIPNKGDVFVERDGLQYVLIEPAGPGWFPPGQVAQSTVALLEGQEGFKIEPFF
jgi:hypothetical protein